MGLVAPGMPVFVDLADDNVTLSPINFPGVVLMFKSSFRIAFQGFEGKQKDLILWKSRDLRPVDPNLKVKSVGIPWCASLYFLLSYCTKSHF